MSLSNYYRKDQKYKDNKSHQVTSMVSLNLIYEYSAITHFSLLPAKFV